MTKVLDVFHRLTGIAAVLSFSGMIVCVSIQVFSRFFMENTPTWTEELSRLFFIYSVSFGMSLAFKHDAIVKLDLIERYVSKRTSDTIQLFTKIVISGFGFFMFFYALNFALIGLNEKSPALEFSMIFAFASIPIMMVIVFSCSLLQIITHFKKVKA